MSRFEWRVAVPLPVHEYLNYTVQADFELPSISTLSPSPWDQLQGFTRREEPQVVGASADSDATVHLIRQQVLVLEQMLQRARQGVLRHCRLVCEHPGGRVAVESLITWLDTAFRALAAARARAVAGKSTDSAELERERILADEFISVRLIDFVADAEAMVDETLLAVAAVDVRFRPSLLVVDEHLVRALDTELNYRKVKGYPIADADSPSSLEQFVERSGRLKKHFEAELALHREAYPVDERLHIWFTCLAALIGGAAREWCNETTTSRPDPLNPESGATLRVTLVNHVHRGAIAPQPQLAAAGVRHVRQLFRLSVAGWPPYSRAPAPWRHRPERLGHRVAPHARSRSGDGMAPALVGVAGGVSALTSREGEDRRRSPPGI